MRGVSSWRCSIRMEVDWVNCMTTPNLQTVFGPRHVLCCAGELYHWHGNAAKGKSARNCFDPPRIIVATRNRRIAGADIVVGGQAATRFLPRCSGVPDGAVASDRHGVHPTGMGM